MDDLERTLLVKPEVFVYKIPPRTSAKGYRAADWKLDAPDWTGRLRCIEKNSKCEIRLEDKNSGELFAACPVENYPGTSVEAVTDSSRYFVICIQDSGRKAYIGIGFTDRSDSFDLNVTLQDHFKQLKKEDLFSKEASDPPKPNLDLAFKEGQTIRINIPSKAANANATNPANTGRPKANRSMGGILPPPPGGGGGSASVPRIPPSVSSGSLSSSSGPVISGSGTAAVADLLGDFGMPTPAAAPAAAAAPTVAEPSKAFSDFDEWGDFASSKGPPSTQTVSSGNWEQF